MNKRRLSYGLLLTFAGAMMAACSDPPPEVPPQPSAAPVEAPPPPVEPPPAPVVTAAPEPPPPPPKPAKEKFVGKFAQAFDGDIKDAAEAAFKKSPAAKKDADGKKLAAAMEKAAKFADATLENTADSFVWSVKGKAAHTVDYKVEKGDDPSSLVIKLGKDGKKNLKGAEMAVTFSDDNTFSFKDPFTAKNARTYVFKRQ